MINEEALNELLRQAKIGENKNSGKTENELEWKYWQGRKEALEDLLTMNELIKNW